MYYLLFVRKCHFFLVYIQDGSPDSPDSIRNIHSAITVSFSTLLCDTLREEHALKIYLVSLSFLHSCKYKKVVIT